MARDPPRAGRSTPRPPTWALRPGATGDTDHVTGTMVTLVRPTATDQAQGPRRAAAGALRECAVVGHSSPPNYARPARTHTSTKRSRHRCYSCNARERMSAPKSEGARSASALQFAGVNNVHTEIAFLFTIPDLRFSTQVQIGEATPRRNWSRFPMRIQLTVLDFRRSTQVQIGETTPGSADHVPDAHPVQYHSLATLDGDQIQGLSTLIKRHFMRVVLSILDQIEFDATLETRGPSVPRSPTQAPRCTTSCTRAAL